MTILDRIKRAFRSESKARRVTLWPTWREGQPQWQMTDLSNYIEDGFNTNAIIYSAIMYKVRAAAAAPLRAYEGDRDRKQPAPPDHPLARLLDRPNAHQSMLELEGELRVYYNLFGNAYVLLRRDKALGYPSAMRALRPDRVRHLYRGGDLVGFKYVPEGATEQEGVPMLAQDVMHVRLPNPGDPYAGMGKGLSPVAPMAQSGDVDNAVTAYLKQFFDYGAMPPGMLSFDVLMDPEDVATARGRWMEIYGGSRNWTDIAVMDQGGKYQRLGLSFAELDMRNLDGRNESRMTMPFGVPLTLIESRPEIVQSTYSNKQQDRKMFWQDTMVPELRAFETEWLYFLHGDDGAFPAYDLHGVPALQEARAERTQRLLDAAKSGMVTRATYLEAEGLEYDEVTDNVYLVPIGLRPVPFGEMQETPQQPPQLANPAQRPEALGDDDEEERANSEDEEAQRGKTKARYLSDEEKRLVWKQIDGVAQSFEDDAGRAAIEAFERDRRAIRAIIDAGQKAAHANKATVAWMDILFEVAEYYRDRSKDNWRATFAPVFEAVVLAQGAQLNATYGMTFEVRNLLGEDWYRAYQLQFADPINQTSMDEIRDLFGVAWNQGASVPEMERTLDHLFRQWAYGDADPEKWSFAEARLPLYRRENIARTETMRMSNAGAKALYKDWGVHEKEWLATLDSRTRPEHLAANKQVVAIDSTFEVGGEELQFPGDPAGSPANTCQCRCTVLPVI
jgi:HK97 family phage portal protein